MSRTTSTIAISIGAIMVLLLGVVTNGLLQPVKAPISARVINVQAAITLTEKDRINLFINELLDANSAQCLKNILNKESHFNPKAVNSSSGAKGVGQLLDETYKNIGLKHSADPLAQVIAVIAYVSRHYGANGMCQAWRFHKVHNYY